MGDVMHPRRLLGSPVLLSRCIFAAAFGLFLAPSFSSALPCVQPDAGGTVFLPPAGCPYLSPTQVHMIINGLPPGTTIQVGAQHRDFFNITHMPGGSLFGEIETFTSQLALQLDGTGMLSGFHRTKFIQVDFETNTGASNIGQSFVSL
jgi:hypothetical protein